MMKMTTKSTNVTRILAFALAIALAFNFIPAVNNAKAYSDGEVVASFTYADGVTRSVKYIYVEDIDDYAYYMNEINLKSSSFNVLGFDKYGTIWGITNNESLRFRYVDPYKSCILYYSSAIENVKSLVYDDSGYVVGYLDSSNNKHNTYTIEEQNVESIKEGVQAIDFSTYLPEGYTTTVPPVTAQDPTTESSASTEVPTSTEATTEEATTREEDFFVPVVLKEGNKYIYRAYNTDYVYVANFTLSKNVLKFNGKKYKNVKYAGFVEKTASVVYITKKGQAYVVTFKGKKKTLLKKNAKKLVKTSKGFVTKIKKKSGTLNVTNK